MNQNKRTVSIVGGGLAGSECALQLANMGYKVDLYEMRGTKSTPAHKTTKMGELVCSNSFGSIDQSNAPGQLKWECQQLNCQLLDFAFASQVPAGGALGVDRESFSQQVTEALNAHANIQIHRTVIHSLDQISRPTVIATGPLTDMDLANSMSQHFGDDFLYFFDAIAPIIDTDSINFDIVYRASRWGKGTADYLNCPLSKEEYFAFIEAVKEARKVEAKNFERDTPYFDACLPIEELVRRGDMTPAFGPMRAVGLDNPKTGRRPFAVVQLRQDNKEATAYNIVGFQTKMAYPEQKRVFRMIPGLENAEFLKLGSIHRNLYINSTKCLQANLSSKKDDLLFFAGQITGVEGYFESIATGFLVSQFLHQNLNALTTELPPRATALGSILHAITMEEKDNFQPTNINFGLFPKLETAKKIKKDIKKRTQIINARKAFLNWQRPNSQIPQYTEEDLKKYLTPLLS